MKWVKWYLILSPILYFGAGAIFAWILFKKTVLHIYLGG